MKKLLRCADCNVIYEITPFDQCPEYAVSGDAGEYHEIRKNDLADFERSHRGHRQEHLSVVEGSQYSEGAYFDPLRVTYLEVTNGKEVFLVKRWRKTIAEAMRYELVEGHMEVNRTVEIQERDIIKQLRYEITNPPLQDNTLYRFLDIVHDEALSLDLVHLADELYDSHDAHIFFLPLREKNITSILKKCAAICTPEELLQIEQFMRHNGEYNGVMSFLVKKNATFYPEPLRISLAGTR
jgi:hypothetical protein